LRLQPAIWRPVDLNYFSRKADATWADWMAIADAHMIGREDAMHAAGTNQPIGSRYNAEFGEWLRKTGFDDMDKGDRRRLFEVMEHRGEIEAWRATLPSNIRLRINHPSTVLRKWRASTSPRKERGPTKAAATSAELATALEQVGQLIFAEPILWFSAHSRTGRGISLVLPWFEADNCCGSRGTVRVPMLVRILRTYQLPEILMVAAATLFVVVSAAYWWGG
jgi:hypothetical protein